MNFDISLSLSIVIFVLSCLKTTYDLSISSYLHKKDIEKSAVEDDLEQSYNNIDMKRKKNKRDKLVSTLFFIIVSILTLIILWENTMNRGISRAEFDDLERRVAELEDKPNGPHGNGLVPLNKEGKRKMQAMQKQIDVLKQQMRQVTKEYAIEDGVKVKYQ